MRFALGAALLTLLASPAGAQDWVAQCRADASRGITIACERAIDLTPNDPELYALLGDAYFSAGRYGEGLYALQEAVAVSNGQPEYRFRFAGYAALVNEYILAAEELELAVQARPEDRKAWALLADCYRSLENDAQALRASRRAAELGDPAEAYAMSGRFAAGRGVPPSPAEELRWLEASAGGGHVAAMQDLAQIYGEGRPGIPPDPAKQRRWREAASAAMQR